MFGHQDDKPQQDTNTSTDQPAEPEDRASGAPAAPPSAAEPATISESDAGDSSEVLPKPAIAAVAPPADDESWQHPGTPLPDKKEPIEDVISPAGGFPKKPTFQYPSPFSKPLSIPNPFPLDDAIDDADSELIGIKKKALDELIPIIDQLDLPPEEKFRTVMMMIQSSDNEGLVKAAYAAAHSIEDEKIRARALLDIVNEVNYFTQPHTEA